MNLLLGKFSNINNIDLQNVINCYQNYFIFESNKSDTDTFLYLDTKILKKYLKKGLDIKHRKYIFLFLKDIIKDYKSKYKILKNIPNIIINDKIHNNLNNDLNIYDNKNLELIINISNKIIKKYNKISIKDKNIIKLSSNFYANIDLNRFYFTKIKDKIFKFNGIILNYKNIIKNKILTLLSINYNNKINKEHIINNTNKKILNLHTKCTLILTEFNNNIEWENIINKYLSNIKYKIINTKNHFKNIFNKDILNLDFLIININILSSIYYKKYFNKYENNKNDNYIAIINSIHDNLYNINIENELFNNLYIFQWNNIIYDNIQKIKNIDKNNFINYLTCNNIKYYLLNNNLDNITLNYIIKNNIRDNNNKNLDDSLLFEYDIDNFYYFFKNELLIKCQSEYVNIKYNFIDLTLSEYEKNIYNKLFDNDNDNIYKNSDKSIFFLECYKYIFENNTIDEIIIKIQLHYNNLINTENEKIIFLENLYKNKNIYKNNNNYKNLYFFDILIEKSNEDIDIIINDIKNNINLYNLKLHYCKSILENIDNIQCNCTICIDNVNKNNICILNCGHYFCNDCIIKYINQKNDNYECPICRDKFSINDIYCTYINDNNKNYGTKINKLIEIINSLLNKKILVVFQYDKIANTMKKILNLNNITNFDIFYKNKILKEKYIKIFELYEEKSILLCNYDDIINYNFVNIQEIILLDYPDDENIFIKFKNKLNEDIYVENKIINLNLLYIKDTFEEKFIDKYIK
jgi:hypothetical protein